MGSKQRTFHKVALLVHYYQVELEFGMLVRRKNRRTLKKTHGARTRTNYKLNPPVKP